MSRSTFTSARHLFVSIAVPLLFLELGRAFLGASFSWQGLSLHLVFVALVVVLGAWSHPMRCVQHRYAWPGLFLMLVLIVASASIWALVPALDVGPWLLLGSYYGLLIGVDQVLTSHTTWLRRWLLHAVVALSAGALPVGIVQIESRFADEEFFAALQLLMLGFLWFLLRTASTWLAPHLRRSSPRVRSVWRGVVAVLVCLSVAAGIVYLVRAYQGSFYSLDVPQYPGITSDVPYLCGKTAPQQETVTGAEVFDKLIAAVAASPNKGTPELGMLALATGDPGWVQQFRIGLLAEAESGLFAGPAGSVKYQQYLAAFRLYYFLAVDRAFPELFSVEEHRLLTTWFAAINERALTVEWVDWMYSLAFSMWPEGPYENQETGSAFLSLMEAGDISSETLSARNQAYLGEDARGWAWRFRNTDDAFVYQPEWINNAYYQALLTGQMPQDAVRKSFEWMALQLPPGGAPLSYNHPAVPHVSAVMLLGAELLADPRYVWLADQTLNAMSSLGRYPSAQPGLEHAFDITGVPPDEGSCLMYGDSGLPNQSGPLAPDKVVLRDGWMADDTYLLLNLRFSGWHRYKATNAVSMVYWQGPIAVEVLDARSFDWLPEGRSLFRDKRIPRENLNGLVVERTGMSAVVRSLTGYGGVWAQDPPHYASVMHFETSEDVDRVETQVVAWRGWTHERTLSLFHDQGPIVVIDEAQGPFSRKAAVVWHLVGDEVASDGRRVLRHGDAPAAVVLVDLVNTASEVNVVDEGDGRYRVIAQAQDHVRLATVFLPGAWAGANVSWDAERDALMIVSGAEVRVVELVGRTTSATP